MRLAANAAWLLTISGCVLGLAAPAWAQAGAGAPAAVPYPVIIRELKLVDGQLAPDARLVPALKGDVLRWRVSSNQAGEVHVHAYRVSVKVQPGQAAELSFVAHASGRFRVEWHAAGETAAAASKHHAAALAHLEVRPR